MKAFAAAVTLGAVYAIDATEMKYMKHLAKFGKILKTVEEFNTRLNFFAVAD